MHLLLRTPVPLPKKEVEILGMTQELSGGVRYSSLMQSPGGLTTGPP